MFVMIFELEQEYGVSYIYIHPAWADAQSKQNPPFEAQTGK